MTVNWMARIQFPTGAGTLFIILSRPDLGPPTLIPNGLQQLIPLKWQGAELMQFDLQFY